MKKKKKNRRNPLKRKKAKRNPKRYLKLSPFKPKPAGTYPYLAADFRRNPKRYLKLSPFKPKPFGTYPYLTGDLRRNPLLPGVRKGVSWENGECDFCGDNCVVAVSEQGRQIAKICELCARWASNYLMTRYDNQD